MRAIVKGKRQKKHFLYVVVAVGLTVSIELLINYCFVIKQWRTLRNRSGLVIPTEVGTRVVPLLEGFQLRPHHRTFLLAKRIGIAIN